MASKPVVEKTVQRVFAKYPNRIPGFAGGVDTVIEDWEAGYAKIPDEKLRAATTQFIQNTETMNFNDCPFAIIRTLAYSLMEKAQAGFKIPKEIPDEVCQDGLKKVREIMGKLSGVGKIKLSGSVEEEKRRQLAALGV